MRPPQPALRIALSIVSSLSQPCSSATCGRYVALKECFRERTGEGVVERGAEAEAEVEVGVEEPSGEGADEGEGATGSAEGCGKEMRMPCTPSVQSR